MIPFLLSVLAGLALGLGAIALGFWLGQRRKDVNEEAEGWLLLSSEQGAGSMAVPRPAAPEPIDPALLEARMQALRDEVSALAKVPVTPFFIGDPVELVEPPEDDDGPEGTVWRIRPAPPEVLVIWGTDEEPRWHHIHELKAAGS